MFRPWGLLDWSLALTNPRNWHFVGCLGTEFRSLSAWRMMKARGEVTAETMLRIRDENSRYTALAEQRLTARLSDFAAAGGDQAVIRDFRLLERIDGPLRLAEGICNTSQHVVLDISSMPKRFFFVLLKRLMLATKVRDLLIIYSLPAGYESNGPLCEDPDPWGNLPTFLGREDAGADERLIVNIGFMPEGLQEHLSKVTPAQRVSLLIPFPAPISAVQRSWEAVYRIEGGRERDTFAEYRVEAKDISEAFDRIISLTENGSRPATLAPFGPKTISAAMCMFATLTESPVYYAQPKVYHPDYTAGLGEVGGRQQIYGYWIKHDGDRLYTIP
jgi:hypothetical protein